MSHSHQSGKQKTQPPVRSVADKPEYRHLFEKGGPLEIPVARRTELPSRYLTLEQPPISAFDDNPVFNESGAATILGLSPEQLKKWRQRNMGPDYIQYGPAGPVRYTLNALMTFRATYTVKPKQK